MSESIVESPRRTRRLAMLAILVLASLARLVDLRSSPPWYHDECTFVGETWNLMHGRFAWDAVDHTFLPHLPLFHILVMPFFFLFGKDILWVRLTTALYGIATTWLVYRIGRELGGRRSALIASLLFAICPYTVLLNRWGFTYDLGSVLGAANLYFLLRFQRRPAEPRHLWFAAAAAGLGLATHPVMVSRFVLLALAAAALGGRRRALAATAWALLPLAVYAAIMLGFYRRILLEDAGVILGERVPGNPDWYTLSQPLVWFLSELGGYGILGLVGLAFVKRRRGLALTACAFVLDLLLNLKLSAQDPGRLYRMGIILTPILFVGAGFVLGEAWRRLGGEARRAGQAALAWLEALRGGAFLPSEMRLFRFLFGLGKYCLLAALMVILGAKTLKGVTGTFPNLPEKYERASLKSIPEADAAAAWLNRLVQPDDLVIVTHMEWMLNCRVASPMLVQLADGGKGSPIYPETLRERFRYPCRLADARFAVIHDATPELERVYGLAPTLRPILDGWTKVFADGFMRIYANPDRPENREIIRHPGDRE
ncbi:MAG: glycosyltransferase family 39 protein [Candidatus Sumerlaeota bacterium]|nr:glycosyltransferase family 39 protein [Candidatus Sumerlaeota bacterium]